MFEIDKKYILERYKEFMAEKEETSADIDDLNLKPSRRAVLQRVLTLYNFIVNNSIPLIRRQYVHDDETFSFIQNKLKSYVKNKLRSSSDGNIYIKINNLVALNGDLEEYKKWLTNNKNTQYNVVKNIVDELNLFLKGQPVEDKNKPVLNDKLRLEYVFSLIPDDYIIEASEGNFDNFDKSFESAMVNLNVNREVWIPILSTMKSKMIKEEDPIDVNDIVEDESSDIESESLLQNKDNETGE